MFFDGVQDLTRIIVVGVSAYVALVFILRVTGKRTLSKMNAFDMVVTVAFGSTLATVLLNKGVTLAEGVLAFALLAGLQLVVTYASVRSERLQSLVKATPTLLVYRGEVISGALLAERVTLDEIQAALRAAGIANLADVNAVVLETDSSFSVLPNSHDGRTATLDNVAGYPARPQAGERS